MSFDLSAAMQMTTKPPAEADGNGPETNTQSVKDKKPESADNTDDESFILSLSRDIEAHLKKTRSSKNEPFPYKSFRPGTSPIDPDIALIQEIIRQNLEALRCREEKARAHYQRHKIHNAARIEKYTRNSVVEYALSLARIRCRNPSLGRVTPELSLSR